MTAVTSPLCPPSAIVEPSPDHIKQAVDLLIAGDLVAFPTETVYGLGADASNEEAIRKLFAAKGRPADHPVIVHLAALDDLEFWARDIPAQAWQIAEKLWPGPLTLILQRKKTVSPLLTGGQDTIGLRMPAHPVAQKLLSTFAEAKKQNTRNGKAADPKIGLAAPSANRFGHISPTQAAHVIDDLSGRVNLILDGGACAVGIESTILALHDGQPRILRPGSIQRPQLEEMLGVPIGVASSHWCGEVRISGALASHYSPDKPTFLLSYEELEATIRGEKMEYWGVISFKAPPPSFHGVWIKMIDAPTTYGQSLYTSLRRLDALPEVKRIFIETVPNAFGWAAIQDRLQRAVGQGNK